jgi:predicted GNAT family acetyltransferase
MNASAEKPLIVNRPEAGRYELSLAGELAAFLDYRASPRQVELVHTEVMPAFEGKGLGSQLAKFALEEARRAGAKVAPSCSFVASYIERHPEYRDLLAAR